MRALIVIGLSSLLSIVGSVQDPVTAYKALRVSQDLFTGLDLADTTSFEPGLLPVVKATRISSFTAARKALLAAIREEAPGIYSFPFFTDHFCERFLKELDNYYSTGLPIRRPNSMNRYGIIVNEIGMKPMIDKLQREVLQPVAALLFPEAGGKFDNHHAFMVQYKQEQDLGLDMHTDDSDVTFNICLGREFTGAGLTFCGKVGEANHRRFNHTYAHERGRAVVHLGTQRHGADDIQTGERNNLIVWNHNHAWRNSDKYQTQRQRYAKEEAAPSPECLSYTHDRDYEAYRALPPGQEGHHGRGWCPPEHACYDGMQAVFREL